MVDCFIVHELAQMGCERLVADAVERRQKSTGAGRRRFRVVGGGVDLGPIAGREYQALAHAAPELGQCRGELVLRKRDRLSYMEWGGLVIDPDEEDLHG